MLVIGEITEQVPVVSLTTKSSDINLIFENNPDLEGILVSDLTPDIPAGLVMKGHFYQKISSKYGFDLFMGRPVHLVMDKNPLIVDYYESIITVSAQAMNRSQMNLYDYVVVVKEGVLHGIVSIKTLLIKLAEVQVNQAMFTNPLSGLPGNVLIDEKIIEYIQTESKSFTMLYLDLDHFKEYNDTYGFNKGDLLIKEVADLLTKYALVSEDSFVGHVGGDDFVAILPNHFYKQICESILNEFKMRIQSFYDVTDWEKQFVVTKDRNGVLGEIPLVSLSIAVVTNENHRFKTMEELSKVVADVKKQCKSSPDSCYVVYSESHDNWIEA